MEESKIQESLMLLNDRMTRFEERQSNLQCDFKEFKDQSRADSKELKESIKEIRETTNSLKTADAVSDAIKALYAWNKQTWSRPLTIALIVALIGFIGVLVSLSYKSNSALDKTAQSMIDLSTALKTVIVQPTPGGYR